MGRTRFPFLVIVAKPSHTPALVIPIQIDDWGGLKNDIPRTGDAIPQNLWLVRWSFYDLGAMAFYDNVPTNSGLDDFMQ